MIYETIILEKADDTATITLNRPRAMNAITRKMLNEIQQVVSDIRNDSSVKVVVFKAAGDRAFSAGTDLCRWWCLRWPFPWRDLIAGPTQGSRW
jgi:enoyl-CoA hydratase/carnithine racemase